MRPGFAPAQVDSPTPGRETGLAGPVLPPHIAFPYSETQRPTPDRCTHSIQQPNSFRTAVAFSRKRWAAPSRSLKEPRIRPCLQTIESICSTN